jgi:exonuclease SbcC
VRLAELESALAGAAELERQLAAAQEQLDALRSQEARARLVLGAAQQKLEHCQTLRTEREQQSKRLRQLAEEKGVYRDLQTAFGQKGLRAMIIESVIPEIEEEANSLLARMTDNRMHIRFDTQRETQKGDTVETLDIKIADELGTRSYEMYSGGEAFRMNFALRIALSKLLARRAGAQLQTLIIDEGFGTQDAQGRERLIEAINSIKDDFACILVITHLEELQEAFPVRINVFKTAEGSRFEVV